MNTLCSSSLQIFTDGSFDVELRRGGWAYVVMDGDKTIHSAHGTSDGVSNNTFEVMAVLEALSWLDASALNHAVLLLSDSAHVIDGCNRSRAIWRNNGWRRIDPHPGARRRKIPDMQLWQQLDTILIRNPDVTVSWCKAHSGIAGNEQADALAGGKARALDLAGH